MGGWVYILASKRNGTLYTGVTANLPERIWQHRNKMIPGFTAEHNVTMLVWYSFFERIEDAIVEEKAHQEMAARVENLANRENKSSVARSV